AAGLRSPAGAVVADQSIDADSAGDPREDAAARSTAAADADRLQADAARAARPRPRDARSARSARSSARRSIYPLAAAGARSPEERGRADRRNAAESSARGDRSAPGDRLPLAPPDLKDRWRARERALHAGGRERGGQRSTATKTDAVHLRR